MLQRYEESDNDSGIALATPGIPASLFAELAADEADGFRCEAEVSEEELAAMYEAEKAKPADAVLGRINPLFAEACLDHIARRHGRSDMCLVLLDGQVIIPGAGYVDPNELEALEGYVSEHNAREKELAFEGVSVRAIGSRYTGRAKLAGGAWQAARGERKSERFATYDAAERAARALLAELKAGKPAKVA